LRIKDYHIDKKTSCSWKRIFTYLEDQIHQTQEVYNITLRSLLEEDFHTDQSLEEAYHIDRRVPQRSNFGNQILGAQKFKIRLAPLVLVSGAVRKGAYSSAPLLSGISRS
jgi:hypothetical protein